MNLRSFVFVLMMLAVSVLPATAGDGPLVEVPLDVDVYAKPGGEGQPIGMLKGGTKVHLATKGEDHWCKVYDNNVPNGEGWVWCGIGDDGQNYSLKPAAADTPAVTGCPPGSTLSEAGFCFSPECGKDQSMRCVEKCEYCAGIRGGPRPGEVVLPCKDCLPTAVCTCCVTKLSCLQGKSASGKPGED